jgi:hypothetical protein
MKSITKLIVILGFIFHLNGQNEVLKFKIDSKAEQFYRNIKIDKDILGINSFKMLVVPQFGGLFNESFKYVEGITNLKMMFDDFDFAFNLGLKYILLGKITISAAYNMGVLKFENQCDNKISGANIKVVLNYKI